MYKKALAGLGPRMLTTKGKKKVKMLRMIRK